MKKIIGLASILILCLSNINFANCYTGKTKEEAVAKWQYAYNQEHNKSLQAYIQKHQKELLLVFEQLKQQGYEDVYINTPLGPIKRFN